MHLIVCVNLAFSTCVIIDAGLGCLLADINTNNEFEKIPTNRISEPLMAPIM